MTQAKAMDTKGKRRQCVFSLPLFSRCRFLSRSKWNETLIQVRMQIAPNEDVENNKALIKLRELRY